MSKYFHKFEVRWNDIDANRHLANSSYVQYCAQTRMAFMTKHKMGLRELNRWGIGPVILHERYSFFKEIYMDQEVYVSLEIDGFSEDGGIYRFVHKFYLPDGTHCATAEATGVWIDMMLRKSTTPPDDIMVVMKQYQSEHTQVLTKEDIKNLPFRPENLNADAFKEEKWTKINLRP
ncbi:acyl-CoA thioesterase [Bergeyella porcorum]|uniref:acyl-CoA thioesterase n=1 Tax=Bergeyella porcorum TaxID=1735111 RepID=UPI0035EED829